MPIEFPCPHCDQRMRTPDESAGKRTRCPGCQAIVAVPETGAASSAEAALASPANFERPAEVKTQQPFPDENPYLAPGSGSSETASTPLAGREIDRELRDAVFGPPVELRHAKVTFDEMLQRTWRIFTQRLGWCVVYALILLGVNTGVSIVTGIINFSTQVAAQSFDAFWIAFVGQGVSQIINMIFQAWITAGAMLYMIDMARYGNARFSDIFRGHPYLLRLFLFNLLVVVIVYGILGLCAVPGIVAIINQADTEWIVAGFAPVVLLGLPFVIWLTISWYLTALLIIERDQRLLEALRTSWRLMRGNRLIVFVGGAAVGALSLLFLLFTCVFLGLPLVIPFVTLFTCVVYLLATGQGVEKATSEPPKEWNAAY